MSHTVAAHQIKPSLSSELFHPAKCRTGRRLNVKSVSICPDSSEDEGVPAKTSPSESVAGAYKTPREKRISNHRPSYLINNTLPTLETGMSKIEFGVRSGDFTPLVFKTVTNEADAEREIEFLNLVAGLPHVIQLLDTFEDDSHHRVLVLPVLRPLNLEALDLRDVSKYAWQMIKALQGIHRRNVVHMDVTLTNLMADEEGDLVLIDFGLSTLLQAGARCPARGTPGFIAPEVFEAEAKLTAKVDIYSAGVVLGCMLRHYIGCNLQYLGGGLVRASTTESIVSDLEAFVSRLPSGAMFLRPANGTSSVSSTDALDFPKVVYLAADLLGAMLRTDPAERPTSEELLSHPFLQASQRPDMEDWFRGTDRQSFELLRHEVEINERRWQSASQYSGSDDEC
ncbi:hypothetical protein L0F63_003989 [Massospora cicadina]|nr:hypothetical protein L0F63_003989 [Massospora cicadina]